MTGVQTCALPIYRLMKDNPNMTFLEALQAVKGAGRTESVDLQKDKAALDAIGKRLIMLDPKKDAAEYKSLQEVQQQILRRLQGSKVATQPSGDKPSVTNW